MTEQDFMMQVWRPHDRITTTNGVPGKVIGVSFTTKSVRAFISGAPEWVACALIETHKDAKGSDGDDVAIIEELHNKVLTQCEQIERLKEENKALSEKLSKKCIGGLLRSVSLIECGLQEKKQRIEQIENGLKQLQDALANINEQ